MKLHVAVGQSQSCTAGEHQNRWYMGVHPPQNGGIGYDPWPSRIDAFRPSSPLGFVSASPVTLTPDLRNPDRFILIGGCPIPFSGWIQTTFGGNTRLGRVYESWVHNSWRPRLDIGFIAIWHPRDLFASGGVGDDDARSCSGRNKLPA